MSQAHDGVAIAAKSILAATLLALLASTPAAAGGNPAEYLGPEPYLTDEDSLFIVDSFGFCIEDFENGKLDVPGVTGNSTIIGPSGLTDSVDGDDIVIDGSGTNGHSYFNGNGAAGVVFEFDPARANGLPTVVGIVWTDGGFSGPVTFEAFGPDNQSVLGLPHGPFLHADNSNSGETAEDRFYGVVHGEGIRRIVITNTGGGIEVDHLQLNNCIACGDTNGDLNVAAADALFVLRTSVGSEECLACICDVNGSGGISATDALNVLKAAVGLAPVTGCPDCPPIV